MMKSHFGAHLNFEVIFGDISERNNDCFDTLDFRRRWEGEVLVTFFVLEDPDYKFAMLIYLYRVTKKCFRQKFWNFIKKLFSIEEFL